jgi:flagellar motor component MotA
MTETILTRLGVFLALCGILYGFTYIGDHPGAFGAFCGIVIIVSGSFAFFYLSSLGDRHDEDHDPY